MKIWLFVEKINPMLWGIRVGKKWRTAKNISVNIPLKSKIAKKAPHCYLEGIGQAIFKQGNVHIKRIHGGGP